MTTLSDLQDDVARERTKVKPIPMWAIAVTPVAGTLPPIPGSDLFRIEARRRGAGDVIDERHEGMTVAGDNWQGDVVHVEAGDGPVTLFHVSVPTGVVPPTGRFALRPMDFLLHLHDVLGVGAHRQALDQRVHEIESMTVAPQGSPVRPSAAVPWLHRVSAIWGPPGTGKTHTIGNLVASFLGAASAQRALVVAPTNKAADEATASIWRALTAAGTSPGKVWRVGNGTRLDRKTYGPMVPSGVPPEVAETLRALEARIASATDAAEIAQCKAWLAKLGQTPDLSDVAFLGPSPQVVVATVYNAIKMLSPRRAHAPASFDTVFIDEAGMVSLPAAVAVGLHARHRLVLAGDPRQLAPIGDQMSLRRGALDGLTAGVSNSTLLDEQRRMDDPICQVVSRYSYDGHLRTHASLQARTPVSAVLPAFRPGRLSVVLLDHPSGDWGATVRSELGHGHRSRLRRATKDVLHRLFAAMPDLGREEGAFITPFRAQARFANRWLKDAGASGWSSSTVHARQGGEYDFVIFDTVDLSKGAGWQHSEWKRLINVGASRGRRWVVVLTTQAELRPASGFVQDFVNAVRGAGGADAFSYLSPGSGGFVPTTATSGAPAEDPRLQNPGPTLGYEIALARVQTPVLTREQEALVRGLRGNGPVLVRGVAGSGKTVVLAHWVVRALQSKPNASVLVLCSNDSLPGWIDASIESAARSAGYQGSLAAVKAQSVNTWLGFFPAEGDDWATRRAEAAQRRPTHQRYDFAFIDEAQDIPLEVLRAVVRETRSLAGDPKRPEVRLFFDNLQATVPTDLRQLGLPLAGGRVKVMKESFRSTREINQFALNVLERMDVSDHARADIRELSEGRFVVGPIGARDVRFVARSGRPVEVVWEDTKDYNALLPRLKERLEGWHHEGVAWGEMAVITQTIWPKVRKGIKYSLESSGLGQVQVLSALGAKGKEYPAVAVYQAQGFEKDHGNYRSLFAAMTRAQHALWVGGFGEHPLRAALEGARQVAAAAPPAEPTREELLDSAIEYLEMELGRPMTLQSRRDLTREVANAAQVTIEIVGGQHPLLVWVTRAGARVVLLSADASDPRRRAVEATGAAVFGASW